LRVARLASVGYDQEREYNASVDRGAWQSSTVNLPFSP